MDDYGNQMVEFDRRLRNVEVISAEMVASMKSIDTAAGEMRDYAREMRSYTKQLAEVATRQEEDRSAIKRAHNTIGKIDDRVRLIEMRMPGLDTMQGIAVRWIERAGIAGAAWFIAKYFGG